MSQSIHNNYVLIQILTENKPIWLLFTYNTGFIRD